jgi:hypothetical protein
VLKEASRFGEGPGQKEELPVLEKMGLAGVETSGVSR